SGSERDLGAGHVERDIDRSRVARERDCIGYDGASVDAGRKRQQRLDGSRYVLVAVGGSRPGYGQWTGAQYFNVGHVGAVNGAGVICEGAYVDGRARLAGDGDFVRFAVAQFVGEGESAGGVDRQL